MIDKQLVGLQAHIILFVSATRPFTSRVKLRTNLNLISLSEFTTMNVP